MKSPLLLLLIMAIGLFVPSEAYRILAIFPFCSRSHNMMFDALMAGLTKKGHQIDLVTCFPPKNLPNVNVIFNVEKTQAKLVNSWNVSMALNVGHDTMKVIAGIYGNDLCHIMGVDELQRIVKSPPNDPPYDLVITEAFGSRCFQGYGAFFKVPVVIASTTVEYPWVDHSIGNPTNAAFYPSFYSDYTHPMTFWTRVKNTVNDLVSIYRFNSLTDEVQTELMRKYLHNQDIPHVRELEKNVTVALVNSFHSLSGVRPTTTNLIEVGGMHVENNNGKLTEDLKKWLDESKDGLVYFTLGSMVNIETTPDDTVRGLYAAFEEIAPVRVVMKVANKDRLLPGLPKNVMISSWIPQVPVLAHNNTRAFVTHGGLMSTQEALYHGVPLIGIPLFGDQPVNVRYYTRKGIAVMLNFNDINKASMSAALNKVLNDPSYRKAAQRESALFRDRPMSAVDTAVYWVEYAARNGPNVLRSPAVDLAWWQFLLLDVYAFLLFIIIAAVYITVLLIQFLLKLVISPSKSLTIKRTKRD